MGRHCGSCPHSALMRPFCQLAFLPHGGFPLPIHPITHWPSLPLISLFQSVFFFVDKVGWYVDDDMAEVSAQLSFFRETQAAKLVGQWRGFDADSSPPKEGRLAALPGQRLEKFPPEFLSYFWVSFLLLQPVVAHLPSPTAVSGELGWAAKYMLKKLNRKMLERPNISYLLFSCINQVLIYIGPNTSDHHHHLTMYLKHFISIHFSLSLL